MSLDTTLGKLRPTRGQWRAWVAQEPVLAGIDYPTLRRELCHGSERRTDELLASLARLARREPAAGDVLTACVWPPSERSLRARMAAYESWSRTEDPVARTEPARKAALDRFERQVDPDGKLSPEERARRADQAMRAHMTRIALKSAQSRRKRKAS